MICRQTGSQRTFIPNRDYSRLNQFGLVRGLKSAVALAIRLLGLQRQPSFLRTTPARKPRTECACQPVAFMMAAMVVPCGRLSAASTAAGLDLRVFIGAAESSPCTSKFESK
jgi:hypothetical protein